MKSRFDPKRSPRLPADSSSTANASAYASTTHCSTSTPACSSVAMRGSATLTTVTSSCTTTKPRLVAAITQDSGTLRARDATVINSARPAGRGSLLALLQHAPRNEGRDGGAVVFEQVEQIGLVSELVLRRLGLVALSFLRSLHLVLSQPSAHAIRISRHHESPFWISPNIARLRPDGTSGCARNGT